MRAFFTTSKRLIIGTVLSLCMAVVLIPSVASQVSADHVRRTTGLDLKNSNVTWSGNVTGANPTATNIDASVEGWKWYNTASTSYNAAARITAINHPAKTLILDSLNIETADATALTLPDGATLVLANGSSNIVKSIYNGSEFTQGMYVENLSISGGGSLDVTGGTSTVSSYGISAINLTVNGGNVTASGGRKVINKAYSNPSATITVTADACAYRQELTSTGDVICYVFIIVLQPLIHKANHLNCIRLCVRSYSRL